MSGHTFNKNFFAYSDRYQGVNRLWTLLLPALSLCYLFLNSHLTEVVRQESPDNSEGGMLGQYYNASEPHLYHALRDRVQWGRTYGDHLRKTHTVLQLVSIHNITQPLISMPLICHYVIHGYSMPSICTSHTTTSNDQDSTKYEKLNTRWIQEAFSLLAL